VGLRSEHENLKDHIKTLRIVIFFLMMMVAALWVTTQVLTKTQSVSIPPDIRSGAVVQLNSPHPANVFAFTNYIFTKLNDWQKDGAKDFGKNAYDLQAFISKQFMAKLVTDIKLKRVRGELDGRTRQVNLLSGYDEAHVDIINDSSWVVWLDMELVEHVQGMEIKRIKIRYPIKVTQTQVEQDKNPWGLLLDGYKQVPFEIKDVQ